VWTGLQDKGRDRGVTWIFQRIFTLGQCEGTHQMNSPPVVGCLFKKGLQRGGGVTGIPRPPPLAKPLRDRRGSQKLYQKIQMVHEYYK